MDDTSTDNITFALLPILIATLIALRSTTLWRWTNTRVMVYGGTSSYSVTFTSRSSWHCVQGLA